MRPCGAEGVGLICTVAGGPELPSSPLPGSASSASPGRGDDVPTRTRGLDQDWGGGRPLRAASRQPPPRCRTQEARVSQPSRSASRGPGKGTEVSRGEKGQAEEQWQLQKLLHLLALSPVGQARQGKERPAQAWPIPGARPGHAAVPTVYVHWVSSKLPPSAPSPATYPWISRNRFYRVGE